MVMQLLVRRQNNAISATEWDTLLKLRHHVEDFKAQAEQGDETWGNLQLMARAAHEYSDSKEDLGLVETLVARVSSFIYLEPQPYTYIWAAPYLYCGYG